jgi:5'-3' exonuclease
MEGKKFEWEAVALIPFIDADLLIKTHDELDESLIPPEDRKRNQVLAAIPLYLIDLIDEYLGLCSYYFVKTNVLSIMLKL